MQRSALVVCAVIGVTVYFLVGGKRDEQRIDPARAPKRAKVLSTPRPVPVTPAPTASTYIETRSLAADAPAADLRVAAIAFDPPVRDWAPEGIVPEDPIRFAFFDGVERDLVLETHEATIDDGGVYTGHVAGSPGSYVVLAHVDDAVAGTLYVPGQGTYRVRTDSTGKLVLVEMDTDSIPPEAPIPDSPPSARAPAAQADGIAQADAASTTIDLLIAYTPATLAANGGAAGIAALAASSVATANIAYVNSQIAITLRLVGTLQVSYSESHALGTDLARLATSGDGYMDTVFASRTSFKADLVSLFVTGSSDAAGIGYLWSPSQTGFASIAFSVVVDIYADANLTLAHELGHNMGAGHAAADSGVGAYSYSLGYKFTGNSGASLRTVMAYAPGTRVPYFSNPSVSYDGVPTGTATANNALTLNNSRATVATFQTGLSAADQAWIPVTTGDFNGDHLTDIVWRNSQSGKVIVWYMNGTARTTTATVWSGDPAWVPIAAYDFNGDGACDLLWRNSSTGKVIVWFMNGITMTSTATVWTGDPAWVPITAGKLLGNRNAPSIVWRNSSSGRVITWDFQQLFSSSSLPAYTSNVLWTGDPAWVPVAIQPQDAIARNDVIFKNTSNGRVVEMQLFDETTVAATVAIWTGASTWVPYATGGFNTDQNLQIIWRNSADGRVILWFMNGTTMTSTLPIWQ